MTASTIGAMRVPERNPGPLQRGFTKSCMQGGPGALRSQNRAWPYLCAHLGLVGSILFCVDQFNVHCAPLRTDMKCPIDSYVPIFPNIFKLFPNAQFSMFLVISACTGPFRSRTLMCPRA